VRQDEVSQDGNHEGVGTLFKKVVDPVLKSSSHSLGATVALVERNLLGGDCLNFGCVPSKALIRTARAAAEMRDATAYGIQPVDVRVDFRRVMERMRRLRAELSAKDSAHRYRDDSASMFLLASHILLGPTPSRLTARLCVFTRPASPLALGQRCHPFPGSPRQSI